ncbi:MAG: hypothetical protein SFZ23_07610 [Planctomycetota bacterium]|nr:hypothetical protein [Planctomycetota bacterium]
MKVDAKNANAVSLDRKQRDGMKQAMLPNWSALSLRALGIVACAASIALASPQQSLFVSDWDTNAVIEFDVATGTMIRVAVPEQADGGRVLSALTIAPDGMILLTDYTTDEIRRYSPLTGALVDRFVAAGTGGMFNVTDMTFAPSGDLLVVNGGGGVLRFDGQTGAFLGVLITPEQSPGARFMTFGPSGALYLTDAVRRSVSRFNATTGESLGTFACCFSEGRGLAFTPSGELLVANWEHDRIERFNATTGEYLGVFASNVEAHQMVLGPDGLVYVADGADQRIHRYNSVTGEPLEPLGIGVLDDPWAMGFRSRPTCGADFDSNRVVDFFDYLAFVAALAAGEARSDLNQDGQSDFFDYLRFAEVFDAGCV